MDDNTQFWQPFSTPQPLISPNGGIAMQQIDPANQWHKNMIKRKWSDDLTNFDMSTQNNRQFYTDGYNSSEYNEGDSPESGHARIDQMEVTLQGGNQKERRKEQNRTAQRAFRERKEKFVKELQLKIKHMELKHKDEVELVKKENRELKERIKSMEAEIYTLKGAAMAFNVSIQKLREVGLDLSNRFPPTREPTPPASNKMNTATTSITTNSAATSATSVSTTSIVTNDNSNSLKDANSHVSSADNESRGSQSPTRLGACMISNRNKNQQPIYDPLLDSINASTTKAYQRHQPSAENMEHTFAEREDEAFKKIPNSNNVLSEKMISTTDIWQILAEHPNFDKFDVNELCKPLQDRTRFTGTDPVIPESELRKILHSMDTI
ncbi:hypothetical protein K501DRAFT_303572 [Backusella circina FSU 941]|nr:hypothetical protein K501DRAFT_303572 [Backusella circina FSU 941]